MQSDFEKITDCISWEEAELWSREDGESTWDEYAEVLSDVSLWMIYTNLYYGTHNGSIMIYITMWLYGSHGDVFFDLHWQKTTYFYVKNTPIKILAYQKVGETICQKIKIIEMWKRGWQTLRGVLRIPRREWPRALYFQRPLSRSPLLWRWWKRQKINSKRAASA